MASKAQSGEGTLLGKIFKRYFIDAMSAMALGLFSSLIIGLIISQLAKLPMLSFLSGITGVLSANSPVIGACIGAAIAWGMKCDALVVFSSAAAGAAGYAALAAGGAFVATGGPVGAFIAAVVGAEVGQLVSKKTPLDIVVTPMVTIIAGGLIGTLVGPYVSEAMTALGALVNSATELSPLPMGIAVGVIVGIVLTLPISSAALCIMLSLGGLAAGAATAGCAAQMIGFAVISFGDNGISGLVSQGIGTSMLQVPNIMRKPQIWIAPTVASAVCGALSSSVFGMTNVAAGAGMGTSGLVGQLTMYGVMAPDMGSFKIILLMILVHVIVPAVVALLVDRLLRRIGWVKKGDMTLKTI